MLRSAPRFSPGRNEEAIKEEMLQRMMNLIEQLPPKQREIIKIRLIDKSFEEIAAEFGINKNTLLSRSHNAILNLKKLFFAECA